MKMTMMSALAGLALAGCSLIGFGSRETKVTGLATDQLVSPAKPAGNIASNLIIRKSVARKVEPTYSLALGSAKPGSRGSGGITGAAVI